LLNAVRCLPVPIVAAIFRGRPKRYHTACRLWSVAASKVADAKRALFLSTGASATSVFKDRPLAFGTFSPSVQFLHTGLEVLQQLGVGSIALLGEDGPAEVLFCQGAVQKATQLGLNVTERVTISANLNKTEIALALRRYGAARPDAIVGCTGYLSCTEFLKQAAASDFYAKAMLFVECVSDSRLANDNPLLAPYVLGATPWSEHSTTRDQFAGWSAADFNKRYVDAFKSPPSYHAASTFAGGTLLVNAIEQCGCMEAEAVAKQLKQSHARTVFGDIQFDENRQNVQPFVTVQYDANLTLRVTTAATAIFPIPTWAKRRCEFENRCSDHGGCLDDGTCKSPGCPTGQFPVTEESVQKCEACRPGFFSATSFSVGPCTACAAGTLHRDYVFCFATQHTRGASPCGSCRLLSTRGGPGALHPMRQPRQLLPRVARPK
jgi:ABC-type branched-subunit amino acid transport system substrate-binding protein